LKRPISVAAIVSHAVVGVGYKCYWSFPVAVAGLRVVYCEALVQTATDPYPYS